MGRKRDDEIREEVITNLFDELATEMSASPQSSGIKEAENSDSHSDSDSDSHSNSDSDSDSDNSTQMRTEILETATERESLPAEPNESQATEIVTRPQEKIGKIILESEAPLSPKATDLELSPVSNRVGGAENKLQMAYYLKLAQDKILDLEKEIDRLREENDLLVIAAQTANKQVQEYTEKLSNYERDRVEALEQAQMEINIYRENLASKSKERKLLEDRIRQLEESVSKEIKKVRNRERELENRLELSKQEKMTLLRSKDEAILDLRRRIDDLKVEIENYRSQYSELQKKSETQHGQLSRTVKALRLALAHLESEGDNQSIPFKKAE